MIFNIIEADILATNCGYIAHQINATSMGKAAGVARTIFDAYPHADAYSYRKKIEPMARMGSIEVHDGGDCYVINMLSQYYPGDPDPDISSADSYHAREKWFKKCLNKIAKIKGLESIAFPYKIGCGLAGGHWPNYEKMLLEFARKNDTVEVFLAVHSSHFG
jgi:O-acetyl-ADP-ribose deacetylase (regulator of RNase III)